MAIPRTSVPVHGLIELDSNLSEIARKEMRDVVDSARWNDMQKSIKTTEKMARNESYL